MREVKSVSLDQFKAGESGVIEAYKGQQDLHQRLKELGLVRGTFVTVKRFAPFGDPMEIMVRGYHLSIRKQDAATILVKRQTTDYRLQTLDHRKPPHPVPLPGGEEQGEGASFCCGLKSEVFYSRCLERRKFENAYE